jgi:hypothetical protein
MRLLLTSVSFLIVLAGCSQETLLKKFADPGDEATAKQYIDHLRNGRFDEIEKDADGSIKGQNLHAVLMRMADMLPDREPDSVKLVGTHTMHDPNGVTKNLTLEYDFSGKWFLINVATYEKAGRATIVGFNVYPQPAPLAQQHRFGLQGKTGLQYVVLALAAVLPLLTLYALVLCVRTRMSGRKWPWVLLILVGVGKLAVNWTTGEWNVAPLSIQLFSASAFAPMYGPWVVAVSLPLGALIFLLRRRSLAAR